MYHKTLYPNFVSNHPLAAAYHAFVSNISFKRIPSLVFDALFHLKLKVASHE